MIVNSEEVKFCPRKIKNPTLIVGTNSKYCRNVCKHRDYILGDPGNIIIICKEIDNENKI